MTTCGTGWGEFRCDRPALHAGEHRGKAENVTRIWADSRPEWVRRAQAGTLPAKDMTRGVA